MLSLLPDELVVAIAACVLERSLESMLALGSADKRTRALCKLAMAHVGAWLHVSGCSAVAECAVSFPHAPSLAIEAQVTAPMLAAVMRNSRVRNLCVGAVLACSRDAKSLLRTLAATKLRSLDVTMWHTQSIGLVTTLEGLTMLSSNARTASCLTRITRLRTLRLASCHFIHDISGLAALPSLTSLSLAYCSRLRDISVVSRLVSLVDLRIASPMERVRGVGALSALTSLRHLGVIRARVGMRTVARITSLDSLAIQCALPLHAALDAARALDLRRFDYEHTGPASPVAPIHHWPFTALKSVRLSRCDLECLESLDSLETLVELKLAEIRGMRVLHVRLPRLRILHVYRCSELEELHISALELRDLQVTSCTLPGLVVSHLTRLERLELMCHAPADLGVLAPLTALRRLSVFVAGGVRGVEHTARLSSLTDLTVGAFPERNDATLAVIRELAERAGAMSSVSLTGCSPELAKCVTCPNLHVYPRA